MMLVASLPIKNGLRAAGAALAQGFEEADAGCDRDVEALDRAL
jgi:hypothetical protein